MLKVRMKCQVCNAIVKADNSEKIIILKDSDWSGSYNVLTRAKTDLGIILNLL